MRGNIYIIPSHAEYTKLEKVNIENSKVYLTVKILI